MLTNDVAAELPKSKGLRKKRAQRPKHPNSSRFVYGCHPAVQEQLKASISLPAFLNTGGKLTLDDRRRLVEQALVMLEMTYVHLPMKRTMYAIDPIQRLRLMLYRMSEIPEDRLPEEVVFHNELSDIFTSTRDLHTNYLLPSPYAEKTAFLPFILEEYYDESDVPHYLVSKVSTGFRHDNFKPGVEVLYWNGIPIRRAIEVNANRQAGSNPEARFARGLDSLTIRPLVRVLPPDEEWVEVVYRSEDGKEREIRHDWLIFSPEHSSSGVDPDDAIETAAYLAIDIQTSSIAGTKKILYSPVTVEAETMVQAGTEKSVAVGSGLETTMPGIFRAKVVDTPHGKFGYIRIFTFDVSNADLFLREFIRLAGALPQNGLMVDVRNNGGGLVLAAEGLLQLFTPQHITPACTQFLNTPLTLNLCRNNAPSQELANFNLKPWVDSIARAVETGATYSLAFPITDEKWCNKIGQVYYGPVLVITDALCYSATDIFAAGFQDHNIGPILGTSANTGAGGANVWTHKLLSRLLAGHNSPFKPLPNGAGMRVAIRRTLRNGSMAGYPLEDLGVIPNCRHKMTKNDLLNSNVDLIDRAACLLSEQPVYEFTVDDVSCEQGKLCLTITTSNLNRVDAYLDERPLHTEDVHHSSTSLSIGVPETARVVELRGFCDGRLVAAKKIPI